MLPEYRQDAYDTIIRKKSRGQTALIQLFFLKPVHRKGKSRKKHAKMLSDYVWAIE